MLKVLSVEDLVNVSVVCNSKKEMQTVVEAFSTAGVESNVYFNLEDFDVSVGEPIEGGYREVLYSSDIERFFVSTTDDNEDTTSKEERDVMGTMDYVFEAWLSLLHMRMEFSKEDNNSGEAEAYAKDMMNYVSKVLSGEYDIMEDKEDCDKDLEFAERIMDLNEVMIKEHNARYDEEERIYKELSECGCPTCQVRMHILDNELE